MLIATKGVEDFADLPFYLPGIHFDFGIVIFYESFHKGTKKNQKSEGIRKVTELIKLFLIQTGLIISFYNFFHQLMTDNIFD